MHAEDAYLFRHALLRDAAYQMQMPGDRARLHKLALHLLEALIPAGDVDAVAEEFARHARHAALEDDAESATLLEAELNYLFRAARYNNSKSRLDDAIRLFSKIAKQGSATKSQRVDALSLAGEAGLRGGRLAAAESSLTTAAELVASFDSDPRSSHIASRMAEIQYRKGNTEEAERQFQIVLNAPPTQQTALPYLYASNGQSMVLMKKGKTEECRRVLDEALQVSRKFGLEENGTGLLISMGALLQDIGQFKEAENYYAQAQESASRAGLLMTEAAAIASVATIYTRTERLDMADQAFEESLRIFREIGARVHTAVSLANRAIQRTDEGRLDDAERDTLEARTLFLECGHTALASRCQESLGVIRTGRKDYAGAVALIQQALDSYRKANDRRSEGSVMNNLAIPLFAIGQKREALELLQEALQINQETGHQRARAFGNGLVAGMLIELGRPGEAAEHWKESVSHFGRELQGKEQDEVISRMATALEAAGLPGLNEDHSLDLGET